MKPLAKISQLIAELEGTRPKPFRIHVRRLRVLAEIAYQRLAAYLAALLGGTGAATLLTAMFQLENQTVPLLTGLLQLGIAAGIAWERLQDHAGD